MDSAQPVPNPASAAPTPQGQGDGKTAAPYSGKIQALSSAPKHRGAFFSEDASSKNLALVTAKYKDIKVYWLVDPELDLIYDAKFFSYGGPVSVATGDALSTLVKGLRVETACSLSIGQVESLLRDQPDQPAVPGDPEVQFATIPPLLQAAAEAYPAAKALALATLQMRTSPFAGMVPEKRDYASLTAADQDWLAKPKDQQIQVIEDILTRDVRPGLNMDGGDLQVRDLEDGERLLIKYQGACGSCGSSTGATLAYIEDSLRRQVYGGLQVIPVE